MDTEKTFQSHAVWPVTNVAGDPLKQHTFRRLCLTCHWPERIPVSIPKDITEEQ